MKTKEKLRHDALELRRKYVSSLPLSSATQFGVSLYQNLKPLIQGLKSHHIATYWPMKNEFDTRPINECLQKEGYKLCYPKVAESDQLEFYKVDNLETFVKSRFGFLEPGPGSERCSPSIFLIPLVAFDKHCHRLGYGKGHYDRALYKARLQHNILAIGIAYDMQLIGNIPIEPTDQQMDYVVTEKAVYK